MTVGRDASVPGLALVGQRLDSAALAQAITSRARAQYFFSRNTHPHLRAASSAKGVGRRVVVKVLVIKGGGSAAREALLSHLRYVKRGMEQHEGEPATLFDRNGDQADSCAFAKDCVSDRRHYRLIINPEDGRDLPDIRAYGRSLMARIEEDLGGRIEWLAGDHHDTGRPHLHIAIRGRREDGTSLFMGRDYIRDGLRSRAEEIATDTLGLGRPRFYTHPEHIIADRFTNLDLTLIQTAENGRANLAQIPEAMRSDILRRLVHLEAGSWVSRQSDGKWVLPKDLRERLVAFSERSERATAAAKVLQMSEWPRQPARLEVVNLAPGQGVTGAYVGCAPFGRFSDGPQVVVLDLEDGRLAHLRLPTLKQVFCLDRIPEGAVVEIRGLERTGRASDRTIAEVAANQGGFYSLAAHKSDRPADSTPFITSHLKRLKAMGREGICDPLEGGRFLIPPDYVAQAIAVDRAKEGAAALSVRVLDARTLGDQITAKGFTYLDTFFTETSRPPLKSGFGHKIGEAIGQRASLLGVWNLGGGQPFVLSAEDRSVLRVMEVRSVFERLAERGKPVFLAADGEPFSGVYASRIHVGRQPYAVFEARNATTLAPWRAGLEAYRGRELSGQVTAAVLGFRPVPLARGRGLEL